MKGKSFPHTAIIKIGQVMRCDCSIIAVMEIVKEWHWPFLLVPEGMTLEQTKEMIKPFLEARLLSDEQLIYDISIVSGVSPLVKKAYIERVAKKGVEMSAAMRRSMKKLTKSWKRERAAVRKRNKRGGGIGWYPIQEPQEPKF